MTAVLQPDPKYKAWLPPPVSFYMTNVCTVCFVLFFHLGKPCCSLNMVVKKFDFALFYAVGKVVGPGEDKVCVARKKKLSLKQRAGEHR